MNIVKIVEITTNVMMINDDDGKKCEDDENSEIE